MHFCWHVVNIGSIMTLSLISGLKKLKSHFIWVFANLWS